jgi:CRISPR-associated protein Cmx8
MSEHPESTRPNEPLTLEQRVFRIVGTYVSGRLKSKHGLSWDQFKDKPGERSNWDEGKAKVARDAFLAVRSRTGADFVDYFVGTLCSVPQRMGEEQFVALTAALTTDPDRVRALTLLALAARA